MDQTRAGATMDDLARVEGKAEIVGGEVVRISPTGIDPGSAGDEIFASFREHVRATGRGRAVGDNKAFRARLPNRDSFSPDAAHLAVATRGMSFYDRVPDLAVEVWSEGDRGPRAERALEAKRADYFAAGTLVVRDVDLLSDDLVKVYRSTTPGTPSIYRRGERAEAEPAVPGWSMRVDVVFG